MCVIAVKHGKYELPGENGTIQTVFVPCANWYGVFFVTPSKMHGVFFLNLLRIFPPKTESTTIGVFSLSLPRPLFRSSARHSDIYSAALTRRRGTTCARINVDLFSSCGWYTLSRLGALRRRRFPLPNTRRALHSYVLCALFRVFPLQNASCARLPRRRVRLGTVISYASNYGVTRVCSGDPANHEPNFRTRLFSTPVDLPRKRKYYWRGGKKKKKVRRARRRCRWWWWWWWSCTLRIYFRVVRDVAPVLHAPRYDV